MQHPKSILIERSKQLGLGKPIFSTQNVGPEHDAIFVSDVTLQGQVYGHGEAGTKRDAERLASEEALSTLQNSPNEAVGSAAAPAPQSSPDEPFSGPWPIFAEVLAASLSVAHARVNPTLTGSDAIDEVQALALQLYKGTLENLGEVAEIELEDDDAEPGA